VEMVDVFFSFLKEKDNLLESEDMKAEEKK